MTATLPFSWPATGWSKVFIYKCVQIALTDDGKGEVLQKKGRLPERRWAAEEESLREGTWKSKTLGQAARSSRELRGCWMYTINERLNPYLEVHGQLVDTALSAIRGPGNQIPPLGNLDGGHRFVGWGREAAVEQNVAVWTMTVATGHEPSTPGWPFADGGLRALVEANECGASFVEYDGYEKDGGLDTEVGSVLPEDRRSQHEPAAGVASIAYPGTWNPEQHEQLRRMEQRAPLLCGRPEEGSSGGSTYEAAQDEVRKQLRGVVTQREAQKRPAGPMLTSGAMTAPSALSGTTSGATDPMARLEGLENVIKGGTRGIRKVPLVIDAKVVIGAAAMRTGGRIPPPRLQDHVCRSLAGFACTNEHVPVALRNHAALGGDLATMYISGGMMATVRLAEKVKR
ncbi:hypothetical protein AK812_SmicGene21544 [Symbiodinium microadriaticum]|uniref:Uncharacterized protein n=1 Tax=Symbiodinium microadriaticum TaxID=2951 RepID=A0A1Q9DM90_SYMMI|nr:hypothetical protein AK812_SmicGene21544 [Symbiodinium microadriaticum]